jgi:thiol:disulfide interchange protein DsbD
MSTASQRPQVKIGLALVAAALVGISPAPTLAAPEPAKKDSSPRTRPREAVLTPAIVPTEAKAGAKVTYEVRVKLEPGWHIYTFAKQEQADGPPRPRFTTFDLFDTGGLKVAGDWMVSKPPIQHKEPAFPDLPFLEFYQDEVTWSITLEVPPGTEPGKKTLRCQAGYQICNDQTCKFPGQWTLPDVTLTVVPGIAEAEFARPPAVAALPATGAAPPTPDAPPRDAPEEAVSEVARKAESGLLPFLLFSALGGLGALVMPCVWPMVPITVNFFVKQGQRKGQTTGLAIAYCLSIIGVFTSIGVICSFLFSSAALQNLANNAWLNVAVAILFVAFGLSLLGVFEIRLPSFMLNASAQGESRGGMVGVMFMALTLTITSFTCTFPVVGGLIVMAAKGQFFYPIVGLATFSTVLALPFFLLALSPGLLSQLPKSGDWMNAVKIVGGLIEIGAAAKFLNTAEIGFGAVPEDAWFNAPVVLSLWIVLAVISGLYLLGIFRTDHDHEEVRVGPGRILCGAFFLAIALFLAPVLFGRPPYSQIWHTIVGLLPPDASSFARPAPGAAGPEGVTGCRDVKARSSDPSVAEREEKKCHGVQWGLSLAAAKEQARAEGKPILIDFTGVNCPNCRTMEQGVMPRPEIIALMQRFVPVELFTDFVPIGTLNIEERRTLAAKNQELIFEMAGEAANPFYVALAPDGKVLATTPGAMPPARFADFLQKGLSRYEATNKVAQAGPGQ